MEWIPAGRSTKWPYRIGNRRLPTRRSILWAGCPKGGVYHRPIYDISLILSTLSHLSAILQDMDLSYLSYSIYHTGQSIIWSGYPLGGARNGPRELETARHPPGRSTKLSCIRMIPPRRVAFGRVTRWAVVGLSILSPLLYQSYLSYPTYPLSYRIGLTLTLDRLY